MKLLVFGIAVSVGLSVSEAKAEETLTFEGQVYPLSILTENCRSQADNPQAMIACFNKLSDLLEQQSGKTLDTENLDAEIAKTDKQEADRLEAERQEAERLKAERQEAERLQAEQQNAERAEAERQEAERQEAERQQAERRSAERQEAKRKEAERREIERLVAERLEEERKQAELLQAEIEEAERQKKLASVPEALEKLRALAQYQDDGSGLSIEGTDCNIRIAYFGNYYHLSRRNVSTLDLFSAEFDASQFRHDQLSHVSGTHIAVLRGVMEADATALTHGGGEIDSSLHNFAPKTARETLDAYASEVVRQLSPSQKQTFDFVLVHPAKQDASVNIRSAFETFVSACNG